MPVRELRFGVRDGADRRSETWKCWTVLGKGKRDVYVLCRRMNGMFKLSLHDSGRWHVAYDFERFDAMFEEGHKPSTRFVGVSERPSSDGTGVTLACRIFVPSGAVTIDDPAIATNVIWMPKAAEGRATEFSIFLSDHPYYGLNWPGKITMQTKLVGYLPLEGGGAVFVVVRERPPIDLSYMQKNVTPRYFKDMNKDDFLQANRAIVWGMADNGSIEFIEVPITVAQN
jgi:hypothetical protein